MPVNAKEKTGLGSPLRRVEHARPRASRVLRRVLIGLAGVCMLSTLTASAGVGAQASARRAPGRAAVVPFPLSVSQFALRRVGGLIVGNATVVNRGNARVRSTTGLLALRQGAGGRATGLRTFSVPALQPGSSTKVTLTTRLASSLRARSGKYQALVCTDVYSQISRFTPQRELLVWGQAHHCDKQVFSGIGTGAEHDHSNGRRKSKQRGRRQLFASFRQLGRARSNAALTLRRGSPARARNGTSLLSTGRTPSRCARSAHRVRRI